MNDSLTLTRAAAAAFSHNYQNKDCNSALESCTSYFLLTECDCFHAVPFPLNVVLPPWEDSARQIKRCEHRQVHLRCARIEIEGMLLIEFFFE